MTEVIDTSDGGSVQIHASKSDLSIAHSSPRLESNATTSTACINDVQPLRRDLSSDLLCPLCDHLFDRPVMVTCGHSYCEPCIERHTRNTRSCVICKHDVGPFEAMIPSITLDNMVRKLKNEDIIESSYEESFVSEEKLQKESQSGEGAQQHQQKLIEPPKLVRTMSQKRRLFFSIAGPTICSRYRPGLENHDFQLEKSLEIRFSNKNCLQNYVKAHFSTRKIAENSIFPVQNHSRSSIFSLKT